MIQEYLSLKKYISDAKKVLYNELFSLPFYRIIRMHDIHVRLKMLDSFENYLRGMVLVYAFDKAIVLSKVPRILRREGRA